MVFESFVGGRLRVQRAGVMKIVYLTSKKHKYDFVFNLMRHISLLLLDTLQNPMMVGFLIKIFDKN